MIIQHVMRVSGTRLRLFLLVLVAAGCAVGVSDAISSAAAAELPSEAARTTTRASAKNEAVAPFDPGSWDASVIRSIDPTVFKLALAASRCAVSNGAVDRPPTLTIIDYSKASTEPRMWVLDLASRELLYQELVSHGQGSGGNFATKFSNQRDSHQTSLGLFVTDTTYVGRNGYSLRLDGLDHGFNDRARERAIVMHGAPYVNSETAKSLGRLGRSHGCPAVRETIARELIDRVKGGSLVFSYFPDAEWLKHSKYLGTCGN